MALITHFLAGLDWTTSFQVGAVCGLALGVALCCIASERTDAAPGARRRAARRSAELSKFAALPVLGALLISLVGARFARREKLAAVWFGTKGFACVVYGLLVLQVRHPAGKGGC
ncbi:hypothetical protein [Streptomyces sp. BRA346]|uniref:hypothetical protein n=1 Tax=Streptomyces sp. BRA346 TaxID=2878199 RepID=UPI004062A0C3